MAFKPWLRVVTLACGALLSASAWANFPSVPKELYKALNLEQSASPKELHEAVVKRYKDPAQGAGRGTLAKYWEPIPMSMYFDPASFYKPPTSMKEVADGTNASNATPTNRRYGLLHGRRARTPTWTR